QQIAECSKIRACGQIGRNLNFPAESERFSQYFRCLHGTYFGARYDIIWIDANFFQAGGDLPEPFPTAAGKVTVFVRKLGRTFYRLGMPDKMHLHGHSRGTDFENYPTNSCYCNAKA